MKQVLATTAVLVALAAPTLALTMPVHAAAACNNENLPKRALGICKAPLFKKYTTCIEGAIPNWDPKGSVLRQYGFPVANSILAVLVECEPIAKKFGNKYGNDLANALQETANKIVSERYGTSPLPTPTGDMSTFLEYGERIDPRDAKPGDVAIPLDR